MASTLAERAVMRKRLLEQELEKRQGEKAVLDAGLQALRAGSLAYATPLASKEDKHAYDLRIAAQLIAREVLKIQITALTHRLEENEAWLPVDDAENAKGDDDGNASDQG